MILAFGDCELDTGRHVLRRDGAEQKLEPQTYDVLAYLAHHRGRLVPKEELLDEIWGDRFVSESALTSRIKSARRAVGDDGRSQRVIRTVHGRGYEFVAAVDERTAGADPTRVSGRSAAPLPALPHELLGRDDLLPQLDSALDASRLLTLVGPPGVGKTSVALALAHRVAPRFADGVWPVELARVTRPDEAVPVVATALDMKSQQERSLADSIVEMLGPWRALLLLDNCEHVIEPLSSLVEEILRLTAHVTVIATSREPLATPSEQIWPVDPLPVVADESTEPDRLAENPAVALFVQRARAADPHFELTGTNASAVAEICRRLDGIPLAIELAAARQRSLDVGELAERLNERFRLLRGVRRGTDERHHTLQNAVRWSYDLMSDDEKRAFEALSVFAGPFSLEAAEAVCGTDGGQEPDGLDSLARLVDRSMLTLRRSGPVGGRYEMLETLREFGRSRLGDGEVVGLHRRHGAHFRTLAAHVTASRLAPDERRWIDVANDSFADLRLAQRFALQAGDPDDALGIIADLAEYSMRTMRYEVLGWIDQTLEQPGSAEHPCHPEMVALQGYGAWVRGEHGRASRLAGAALEEAETRGWPRPITAYRVLGNVSYQIGDAESGVANTEAMLDLAHEMDDPSRIAHAAYMHSIAASSQGRLADAAELLAMAEEASRVTMNPTDLASVAVARAFSLQDARAAIESCRTAADLADSAGNRWMSAFARTELVGRLLDRGELDAARAGLGELVDTWYRSGDWSQLWLTMTRSAIALREMAADHLAVLVIGSTDHHAAFATTPLSLPLREAAVRAADELRTELGDEQYHRLLAEGAALPVADLVHRTRAAFRS